MSSDAGTRLHSVNAILARARLGETASLQTGLTSDAANAERELERASLEIQKIGWHFNTRRNVELTRDASNQFRVPDSVITIDTDGADACVDVAQEGGVLYDLKNNTDTFADRSTLRVRYVLFKTLECVPYPVREHIVVTAAYKFVTRYGARFLPPSEHAVLRSELYREMQETRNDARRYDADTSNVNVLRTANVLDITGDRARRGPWGNIGMISGGS